MEPEQEHLSKLYSGSGIHSLPELNPNYIYFLASSLSVQSLSAILVQASA